MLTISKRILIDFRLSVDFRVVYLVSKSDGENGGVCDSKCWTNQMQNAHYSFIYFNEILHHGRVRGSLLSFKYENCKIETLLRIWKRSFINKWWFIVTNYLTSSFQTSFQFLNKGWRGCIQT